MEILEQTSRLPYFCCDCGKPNSKMAVLFDAVQWDGSYATICIDCLKKAVALLEGEK